MLTLKPYISVHNQNWLARDERITEQKTFQYVVVQSLNLIWYKYWGGGGYRGHQVNSQLVGY